MDVSAEHLIEHQPGAVHLHYSSHHSRSAMRNRVFCHAGAALLLAAAVSGCTKAQLNSESPAYAVLDEITAASGAEPSKFSGTLASDVLTMVKKTVNGQQVLVPTIFED